MAVSIIPGMPKKLLLLSIVIALAGSLDAQTRAPQNDSIRQSDLRADLFFLAGDSLRGRLTDTEENRAAGDFIKSRFERMGLKPAGPKNSYYQPYNLMIATLGEGNALDLVAGEGGATRHLRDGQEFYPHRFGASGHVAGPVVFAGFGISAPHLQYDDYNGDVKGKIVLALDHEPGERDPNSPFDGVVTSEPSTAWRKARTSNSPRSSINFIRLSDERLHAELSRCMYSLHGLDALIRPDSGQVCQSLIVVSY